MKKLVVTFLLGIIVFTGCSKNETVKCTMSQEQTGVKINGNLTVELKDKKFDNIELVMDVVIDDAYLSYKDKFISTIESQFTSFESTYGVKPKIDSTDKGAKVTVSMTSAAAEEFYGQKNTKELTRKEVIDTFEQQGYTCK